MPPKGSDTSKRDIVVSRLRFRKRVKVIVVGRTFLISVVRVLRNGMAMVVLIFRGQVFCGKSPGTDLEPMR
jgi:hypothetical protein